MSVERPPPAGGPNHQAFQIRCPTCGRRVAKLNSGCPIHRPLPGSSARSNTSESINNLIEIPGYHIKRVLGQGGFGTIFEAERTGDAAQVAIKVARQDQPLAAVRLRLEGEALKDIGAPFVPAIFECGTLSNGSPFLVMEFLAANTLAERFIATENPLTVNDAKHIILELLKVLSAVHEKGYAHCDLKPENIFLEGNSVRLIDFGLSMKRGGPTQEPSQTLLLGTSEYMSPEQCEGRTDIDLRSDLYSAGILLFEILAGKPPFWGASALVQQYHRNRRPPRLSSIAIVPSKIDEVVSQCLAKDPAGRFSSAVELQRALMEGFKEYSAVRRLTPAAGSPYPRPRRITPMPARDTGQHRRAGLVFFESDKDALTIEKRIRAAGGHLAYASNRHFVAIYSHDVGGNPATRALQAANMLCKHGLCQRALVDLARTLVQTRADGSQRFLSALYFQPAQYPTSADPLGVFLTPNAADVIPNSEGALLPGRGWIQMGSAAPVNMAREQGPAGEPPFFGMETILSELGQSAAACVSQRKTCVLCVTGNEGSGKTRLAREFNHFINKSYQNARIVSVSVRDTGSPHSNALIGQVLAQLLDAPPAAPPDKGRAFICEKMKLPKPAQDWALIALSLGFLAPGAPELSVFEKAAGSLRSTLIRISGEFLRRCASEKPLFIFIDNAHLADETTLNALEYSALSEVHVPLWILALGRPAFLRIRPNWGERAAVSNHLELRPLDANDASALCRHLLLPAEDVPEAAIKRLITWSNRTPGLLLEVVRALKREGIVRKSTKTDRFFVATDELDKTGDLPLAEWFAQREISALTPSLQGFARFVALLGREIAVHDIEKIVRYLDPNLAPDELALDAGVGIQKLIALGILTAKDAANTVEFRHPLVREALTRALPELRRKHIHQAAYQYFRNDPRFAQHPPLAELSFHAQGAGLRAEACELWLRLAAQFQAKHMYTEAESTYSKAIESSDIPLLFAFHQRGITRYRIGRYGDALADFERARRLAEQQARDINTTIELFLDEAMALDWLSEYNSAEERVMSAQALGGADLPKQLYARLVLGLGRSAYRANRHTEAEGLLRRAVELAEALGDSEYETLVIGQSMLGYLLQWLGKHSEAEQALTNAIELSTAHHDLMHLGVALNNRGFLRSVTGDEAGMIADFQQVIGIGREIGQRLFELWGNYNLGEHYYFIGEWEKARPLIAKAVEIDAREAGGEPRATVALMQARLLFFMGSREDAIARARSARARDIQGRENKREDAVLAPSDDVLCKMIELYADDADEKAWDALEALSAEHSVGQERLEVLEARALAAAKHQQFKDAGIILERALELSKQFSNVISVRLRRRLSEFHAQH